MRFKTLPAPAVLAAALLIGVAFAAGEPEGAGKPAPAPAAALKVAVVDLDKVFDKSEEWKDCQEESRRMADRLRRTGDKYEAQRRILTSELENLPPGEERDRKGAELRATAEEAQSTTARLQADLVRQRRESLGKVFNRVGGIIARYAEENGIDLVLKRQDLRVSPDQPAEMNVVLTTAHVLYARASFDITDEIIKRLNADYPKEVLDK